MEILQTKFLPIKKDLKSFSLPLVLIVIVILFFFMQEIFILSTNRILINKGGIEKEILNDVMSIGNKLLEEHLILKGTGNLLGSGSFRDIISLTTNPKPKVYFDMNADGIVDSVVIYTCTNISTTKIDFVLTAYLLKRSERGIINNIYSTMPMEPYSPRIVKILSNNYSTQTQMSEYIQFSMVSVNSVRILDKLIQIKKLNLVAND